MLGILNTNVLSTKSHLNKIPSLDLGLKKVQGAYIFNVIKAHCNKDRKEVDSFQDNLEMLHPGSLCILETLHRIPYKPRIITAVLLPDVNTKIPKGKEALTKEGLD